MTFAPRAVWGDPFDADTAKRFSELLLAPGNFIGRLGGSDFEAVAQSRFRHHHLSSSIKSAFGKLGPSEKRIPYSHPFTVMHLQKVRQLNGYFDTSGKIENYFRYLETLYSAYISTDALIYGTKLLFDAVDQGDQRHPFVPFLNRISQGKEFLSNSFLECVEPFIDSMHKWTTNKKVLIVSPFSDSIRHQYSRRELLHRNVVLPEFQLETYTSPVTYSSMATFWRRPIQARTSNWSDELQLITKEVLEIDFDVAFLSCGSYAMPLGRAIANTNRSAIYIGGALNPLFNIYGKRYDTPFYDAILNLAATIEVFEAPQLDEIRSGRSLPSEALRAYTGKRR